MRAFLLIAFLAAAVPDRPDPAPKQATPPAAQILGDWQVEKMVPAQPLEMETSVMTFTPTEILVAVNGARRPEESATYRLDSSKNPAAIDFVPKNGPKSVPGILKLQGDRLILCFAIEGNRPTAFNPSSQNLTVVLYLKRVKK